MSSLKIKKKNKKEGKKKRRKKEMKFFKIPVNNNSRYCS